MSQILTNFVASQVIPLQHENLLLPNTTVAEVIDYVAPTPVEGAPEWYLGQISWRGLVIPVFSFEAMMNEAIAEPTAKSRVVVFNAISGKGEQSFYAMPTQGIPQLMRLNSKNVSIVDDASASSEVLHCHVVIGDQVAAIPNMDSIEAQLFTQA